MAASNHQQTFPIHQRYIQTAHASGEPLQQRFRGIVVELAEAVSDPGSARKHLLRYLTYPFVYQGPVRHVSRSNGRHYSVLIEVGRSRGNYAAVSLYQPLLLQEGYKHWDEESFVAFGASSCKYCFAYDTMYNHIDDVKNKRERASGHFPEVCLEIIHMLYLVS